MHYPKENFKIKYWAEEDRPREKLLLKGKGSLSDSELIAILIASGNRNETAVELSKRLLNGVKNNLNELGKLSVSELTQLKGIGEAKAISIIAAMELGRRRKSIDGFKRKQIKSSQDVFEQMREYMEDLPHEEFWVVLLNRSNKVIDRVNISKGGVSGTVADLKIIFKLGVERLASSIILCHNHPSGSLEPSEADLTLTKTMQNAGNIMDMPVLDHLIFADSHYFSFADEGLL